MAPYTQNPNPNPFVRFMRQAYNPIGFKKGYNFILFFIFAGAMLGFCLARLEYLSIDGLFKKGTAPGEFYYYEKTYRKVGIALHLCCILPAGILVCFQFVPAIRHKARLFHRLNGYAVIILLFGGVVGALMIARHAFGGTMTSQALVGVLSIGTISSIAMAYYNIKVLQIDQHRAWMLRGWFYAGSIITLRLIQVLAALIISTLGNFYIAMPCAQIAYMGGDINAYAACRADSNAQAAVMANFETATGVEQVAASLQLSFGMAGMLSLLMHAIGVEVYLKLTPAESERLRKVSYERQLERGFSHPGSAGLMADRLGDSEPWIPPTPEHKI